MQKNTVNCMVVDAPLGRANAVSGSEACDLGSAGR